MEDIPVLPTFHARRRRSAAEKVQIVKESLAPNISTAAVTSVYSINSNQLQKLQWQFFQAKLVDHSDPAAVLL